MWTNIDCNKGVDYLQAAVPAWLTRISHFRPANWCNGVDIQTQRLSFSLACIEGGTVIDVMKGGATFGDVDNFVDPSGRHFAVGTLTFWELM